VLFLIKLRALLALTITLTMLTTCGGSAVPPAAEAPTTAPAAQAPTDAPAAEAPTTAPAAQAPTDAPAAEAPTTAPAEPAAAPTEGQAQVGPGGLEFPLKLPYLNFGTVVHLYYTDRERVMTLVDNAQFDWVRQQIHWKDIEGVPGEYYWDELDDIVRTVKGHNKKILISIVRSPSFYTADGSDGLPQDPKDLGNFVAAMAEHYGTDVDAYEIWNEQNLAHETGGRITLDDAGRYVELLAEAYDRIKEVNPAAYVLAGAPSSTGVTREDLAVSDLDYYRAMYTYKDGMIKGKFDFQAVHPGGSANPPGTLASDPENPSPADGWTDDDTFYFRHVENVRRVMEEYGLGDHQIWITEFGWATANNTPGYEFGNQISPELQAEYVIDAMDLAYREYPYVTNMFLWNMNFAVLWGGQGNPDHEQASFGLLNPDWSPRPAYLAVQGYVDRVRKEQPRP
jgi:polysaccharide biosynthesis protein PslG